MLMQTVLTQNGRHQRSLIFVYTVSKCPLLEMLVIDMLMKCYAL